MTQELNGYGPTAGDYMGGTGANLNAQHSYNGNDSNSPGGNSGNSHNGVSDKTTFNIATTHSYDGTFMTMCVNNLHKHEGFKNDMYKDSEGNITVGIGHLLATPEMAAALPFHRTHHITAGHGDSQNVEQGVSPGDIKDAYNKYQADSRFVPGMHLSNDTVTGQCIKDVQTTEVGLRGLYSGYDSFSNSRKTALVDMGFNMGIPKLTSKFPSFNAAVNRGDWTSAATESHRTGLDDSRNPRNKDTHDQLLSDK